MTIEEQLKGIILSRYKSVRAFTTAIDIPYSTLDSVFKRGLLSAGVGTIIKVFNALDLDVESIGAGELKSRPMGIKNPPVPPSGSTGGKVDPERLEALLIEMGYIKLGEDLTDSDLRFLISVGEIVRAWFAERK